MRFQKTVDLLVGMHEAGVRRTVFLIGPPGIGKTSIAREAARQIGGKCWVNDLSSSLVEDLKGLPRPDGDVMRFIPDEKLKEACTDGAKGFFVLDDLAAADRSLQVAARQLSLDLTMHNHILSTDVSVVVTGNRRSDGAAAATLPSHFRNSVITLEVEPSLDDWSAWYRGTGLAPAVLAFLTYRPAHLSQLPDKASENGAFATPRSWAMFAETMPVAQEAGCLFDVASGAVGTGVASEFCAWLALRDKLGQPDQLTAMISGIVEHTLQADKITKASLERLVAAMAWTTRESREFAVFGIQQLAALGSTSVQNRFNRCLVGMRDTNKDVANLLAAFAASVR
jgi:hypothetical protein